ncbi:MAG: hypothetical protein CMP56_04620 [Flavobacteriales bacterium]|jgi:hypothetical protein|nr:hypothetical protein [Flavobacteriales bacterium]|tara:strand:- start:921 stop:1148 length:228 start_codon:yes stop_codon:yes gene_type:complete
MQRRGRPSTQPPKLRDGFYIELRTQGSTSAIKIIRKNMDEVKKAMDLYSANKIVKYLGQVKDGKWVDGDNKGKSI